MYLGHLPSPDPSDEPKGFTAVEAAHRDLLNQVLDDGRSNLFLRPDLLLYGISYITTGDCVLCDLVVPLVA